MAETLQIKGMDELRRKLAEAGERAMPLLTKAMRSAAEQVATDARKRVPVDTGTLMRSIKAQPMERHGSQIVATVGAGGPSIPYAIAVHEYPEHAPRSWQGDVTFSRGGERAGNPKRKVSHSGIVQGHHFLHDATKEMGGRLGEFLAARLGRSLERAIGGR